MNTKEELIDISYWVAISLFKKHAFEPHPVNNALCEVCNMECRNEIHIWPHYARDPAAAVLVLEKCAQWLKSQDREETVSVGCDDPYWVVEKTNCIPNLRSEAAELPLAICLFAQKLFKK